MTHKIIEGSRFARNIIQMFFFFSHYRTRIEDERVIMLMLAFSSSDHEICRFHASL